MVAILVGGLKCPTQFWKGTTQGSFQQSLAEIGSIVSEEKIFLKFHPPFFYFSLVAILVGSWEHGTQFWKGAKIWLQLAQWFLRRRILCKFELILTYTKAAMDN